MLIRVHDLRTGLYTDFEYLRGAWEFVLEKTGWTIGVNGLIYKVYSLRVYPVLCYFSPLVYLRYTRVYDFGHVRYV
jgi:hypothetical protein